MRRGGTVVAPALLALLAAGEARGQIYTRVNANGTVEATNIPDSPDYRLTYPGKGTLIHSRGFRRAYGGEYDSHILDASVIFGVSAELIRSVIAVESEFDRLAVSSKGARGLMQLMPDTARRFGVSDSFDARQNIFGGVQYLRFLLDLFQGELGLALAGYNAGENAVLRFGGIPPYKETRGYVQKIQALLSGVRHLSFAPKRVGPKKAAKLVPARPKTYYKWRDEKGILHIAHDPPSEGTPYATIRALD